MIGAILIPGFNQNFSIILNESFVISFIQNVALLLTVGVVYTYYLKVTNPGNLFYNIYTGLVLGAIGIVLIVIPCNLSLGVTFNLSPVLLLLTGLFFGLVPAAITMVVVCAGTVFLKNPDSVMGMTGIFTAGITVIIWHY
jgi:hypothetical protein